MRYLQSSALYFDFVAGLADPTYLELNLPRWLNGRPVSEALRRNRFSGIEVVGEALDQEARSEADPFRIAQTLKDCCLEEQAIAYYQQQIKDSLEPGDEAA